MNHVKSTEEKIDYIYMTLKKNERKALFGTIFKWGFRLFLLGYMFYFIKVGLPLLIDSFIPSMPTMGESGINSEQIKNVLGEYFSK